MRVSKQVIERVSHLPVAMCAREGGAWSVDGERGGWGAGHTEPTPSQGLTHLGYLPIYLLVLTSLLLTTRTLAAIPELSSTLRRLASSESAAYLTSGSLAPSSFAQPMSSAPVHVPGY